MHIRVILLLFILELNVVALFAQPNQIYFKHLDASSGLSHMQVATLVQDKFGYIWIGTFSGLNCYNGLEINQFVNNPADSNSIADHSILTSLKDKNGNLWFGSRSGLSSYNYNSKTFKNYKLKIANSERRNPVLALLDDSINKIWIGTNSGLFYFDKERDVIKPFDSKDTETSILSQSKIREIKIYNGKLWIPTIGNGIFIIDLKTNLLSHINDADENKLQNNFIENILFDENNQLWILYTNAVIEKRDLNFKLIKQYLNLKDGIKGWKENKGSACYRDSHNRLWFSGYLSGLSMYDAKTDSFYFYSNNPGDVKSLSDNHILTMMEDNEGSMWVGLHNNGVDFFNIEKQIFTVYQKGEKGKSLPENWVRAFAEDDKKNLWIGTVKGISILNRETQSINNLMNDETDDEQLSSNSVRSLLNENDQYMWIGTAGGVSRYDFKNGKIKMYQYDKDNPNSICGNFVWAITKIKTGEIYFCTSSGLSIYRPETDDFYNFDNKPEVKKIFKDNPRCMIEDSEGILWIGTSTKGLIEFHPKKNILIVHNSKNSNGVLPEYLQLCITELNSKIYVGTMNGIFVYDKKTKQFGTLKSGSKNTTTTHANLLVDSNQNLWMTNNDGLVCYNTKDSSFSVYDINNGLPTNSFNFQKGFKTRDGYFCFASYKGAVIFKPEQIQIQITFPEVTISSVKVFNQNLPIGSSAENLNHISLKYNQNFFTIELIAFNYSNPKAIQYAYKLEGFHNDWIYNGNNRYVNLTNVPGGNYKLKYMATLQPGVWPKSSKEISIFISTVFYKTWWFRLLMAVVISGSVYLIYQYRKKQKQKVELMRNKIASDLHDDVGSILSSISIYSSVAKTQIENKELVGEVLDKIGNDSRGMIESMSDIVWTINPVNDNMEQLLLKMESHAAQLLAPKNIQLHFRSDGIDNATHLAMTVRKNLYLIFKEAIHNAYKYADAKNVWVDFSIKSNVLNLTIKDDGKGFTPFSFGSPDSYREGVRSAGNGLTNMKNRAKEINATFDIQSSVDNGTQIILNVKIT